MLLLSSSVSAALLPACSRSKQGGHCAENDTCGTPPINATSAAGGGNIALAVFTPTLKTDERLAPAKRRSGDEVTSLPGWDGPLPSRQFSGMIDAKSWGGQMHQQHYWLVESERDPKNDPLVVWYAARPSCCLLPAGPGPGVGGVRQHWPTAPGCLCLTHSFDRPGTRAARAPARCSGTSSSWGPSG